MRDGSGLRSGEQDGDGRALGARIIGPSWPIAAAPLGPPGGKVQFGMEGSF